MATLISHVWKPSSSRTITIDGFVAVPRGTIPTIPAPLSWPSKDPGDVLDYQLDIEPALVGNEGDAIENVDIDVDPSQPGDLAVDNIAADGYKIIVWLSSGQANITYNVTIKVSLASGRTLQRTMLLPVISMSSWSIPANAIETTTRDSLTDEGGNPIVTT